MAEGLGSGLSRRRVLQGTAWSVPVVLIATAVPARAASVPVAGAIALIDLAASMVETEFRVRCRVAYVDNGDEIEDLPVTDIEVHILLPTGRVAPGFGAVVLNSEWGLVGVSPEGDLTRYRFGRVGNVPLTQQDGVTPVFEAQIAKQGTSLEPVDVTFRAVGWSDSADVPEVEQTIAVELGATLVLNSGNPVRFQQGGAGQNIYAFDGTTRWAGPYWPVGAEASDVTVVARIPQANSTGVLTEQYVGPDWTLEGPPALVDGEWEVVYHYGKELTPDFQNTSTLQFALGTVDPGVVEIANLRTEAEAAGNTAFDEYEGPDNLVHRDWDDVTQYTQGGEIENPYGDPSVDP